MAVLFSNWPLNFYLVFILFLLSALPIVYLFWLLHIATGEHCYLSHVLAARIIAAIAEFLPPFSSSLILALIFPVDAISLQSYSCNSPIAWLILTVIIAIGLFEVLMGGVSTSIGLNNWLVSAGSSIRVEWIFLFDVNLTKAG